MTVKALPCALDDRRLLRVGGADAFSFLQNIVTADLARLEAEGRDMAFSCLLGPQGRVLHEFFILREGDAYLLDCDAGRADDLVKRLSIYKLRARVEMGEDALHVYADTAGGKEGYPDPRHPALGRRIYARDKRDARPRAEYDDFCIARGFPLSCALRPDKDFMTDMNFDFLGAASFDKGCFVGQEVAARMHHRGLAKKRLLVARGEDLAARQGTIMQGGAQVGEIRAVASCGTRALAVARVSALQEQAADADGTPVRFEKPAYFP